MLTWFCSTADEQIPTAAFSRQTPINFILRKFHTFMCTIVLATVPPTLPLLVFAFHRFGPHKINRYI